MAENTFNVAQNFPLGILLDLLIQEMRTVWPSDLRTASFSLDGPPRRTVTVGRLDINTPRDLTLDERSAALAHFQNVHNPANGVLHGLTVAQLNEIAPAGVRTVYVRDLDRAVGPGVGTLAYSNGIEWRRVSDDQLIT